MEVLPGRFVNNIIAPEPFRVPFIDPTVGAPINAGDDRGYDALERAANAFLL